jgi:hypothetical protein
MAGGRDVARAGTATAVKAAMSAARTMTRGDRTSRTPYPEMA